MMDDLADDVCDTDLHIAVRLGDIGDVRQALREGNLKIQILSSVKVHITSLVEVLVPRVVFLQYHTGFLKYIQKNWKEF